MVPLLEKVGSNAIVVPPDLSFFLPCPGFVCKMRWIQRSKEKRRSVDCSIIDFPRTVEILERDMAWPSIKASCTGAHEKKEEDFLITRVALPECDDQPVETAVF